MIEIAGRKLTQEPAHEIVEWMYPSIHGEQSTLTIGMSHVRAADSIRIKYDGSRDGWVIEQASTI